MKTFGYYDNLAKKHKIINEEGINGEQDRPPLAGGISGDDDQTEIISSDRDVDAIVNALKQIVSIAKQALDRRNDQDDDDEEDKDNRKDTADKGDINNVVTRPGSDAGGETAGDMGQEG